MVFEYTKKWKEYIVGIFLVHRLNLKVRPLERFKQGIEPAYNIFATNFILLKFDRGFCEPRAHGLKLRNQGWRTKLSPNVQTSALTTLNSWKF